MGTDRRRRRGAGFGGAVVRVLPAVVAAGLLTLSAGAQNRVFEPVTDEMLRNPSPNDWLAWRGTHRSQGYSPLDQINRDNVRDLQLVWGWAIEEGIRNPHRSSTMASCISAVPAGSCMPSMVQPVTSSGNTVTE